MAIAVSASCYDVPKPDCGFRCGAAGCPEGYTCGSDDRCRRTDAPPDLVCATPDSGPPADTYSPFATLAYPPTGLDLPPQAGINVAFDVEVTNVSETTFTVIDAATQQQLTGEVMYVAGLRRAVFSPDPNFPENSVLIARLDDAITASGSGRPLLPTMFDNIRTGEDTQPPVIVQLLPPEGATGVDAGITVSARFTEQVTGVSSTSVTLTDPAMTAVTGTVAYDAMTKTATFDPAAPLAPNTTYTLTLTSAITDTAGNPLQGAPVTSSFTTAP